MIGAALDPRSWATILIALAVFSGVIRLLLWQRAAPVEARSPRWRLAALISLQLVAGVLLYLILFPPSVATRVGTLIVATAGSPKTIVEAQGDVLVTLPEAGVVAGAERVPDLATALRRHPGAARLRIEGQGLPLRDQAPATIPIDFTPPPPPAGLVELAPPAPVAPGGAFSVGGRIGALAAGTVELVDPAELVVDRARVLPGQRFVLSATARTPGLALFGLRLRDVAGALVEHIDVPVETRPQTQPRVLVIAGAPGAETKYLRRWAQDAGIALTVQIDIGGGVQLGDAPVALSRAALRDIDLVVIDDRAWETLGAGARAALAGATDEGLGLLLRPTGPLSAATRRDWAGLGVSLTGGADSLPLRLDAAPPVPQAAADTPAPADPDLPELARRDLGHEGPGAVSLLRDADGLALASWRARGRGRVGVWTVTDTYALVLTGRPDRYGEMWSELFSALARAGDDSRLRVDELGRTGVRLALCGVIGEGSVVAPDGGSRSLRVDPATGDLACAAYWPGLAGWHLARDGQGRETAFYVHPTDAAPSLMIAANRQATLALTTTPTGRSAAAPPRAPGSPWPWFAALLVALALLWWLERNRRLPVAA